LFVEKHNPATGNWEKVGRELLDSNALSHISYDISEKMGIESEIAYKIVLKYFKGEEPSNRIEKFIMGNLLPKNLPTEDNGLDWWDNKSTGKYPYPYSDQPYGGRCYALFGVLAGVRDYDADMIAGARGLPDDTSPEIQSMSDEWGIDGHSHHHYYLDELLDSPYYKMSEEELYDLGIGSFFFKTMLDDIAKLSDDPEDIRLVFWFDN
jgi:hypothetical protein